MKQLIPFFLLSLLSFTNSANSFADSISLPNLNKNATGTAGSGGTAGHYALDVELVGGATIGSVNQGNPGPTASPWPVIPCDGTNCQSFNSDGSINVKTAPAPNANGSFSNVSVTTSEGSVAAPANAVSLNFELFSTSATTIVWAVTNSATNVLSSSTGTLMEQGRSVENYPAGTGTYLHYLATGAGSNNLAIQWALSQ